MRKPHGIPGLICCHLDLVFPGKGRKHAFFGNSVTEVSSLDDQHGSLRVANSIYFHESAYCTLIISSRFFGHLATPEPALHFPFDEFSQSPVDSLT